MCVCLFRLWTALWKDDDVTGLPSRPNCIYFYSLRPFTKRALCAVSTRHWAKMARRKHLEWPQCLACVPALYPVDSGGKEAGKGGEVER